MSPPRFSQRLYVTLAPADVGMFRFLLEAYGHLAYFTMLDKRVALLKLVYAPGARAQLDRALAAIGQAVPLTVIEPPLRLPNPAADGTSQNQSLPPRTAP